MGCNCVGITPQTEECYAQTIMVKIPRHMSAYKAARMKAGLSDHICIDPCIYDQILSLWDKGIITLGSCCGHNKYNAYVGVSNACVDKMLKMGYKRDLNCSGNGFLLNKTE
jgi:hypothetical protein